MFLFLIGIFFCYFFYLIWHSSQKQLYWKKKGVPYAKTIPLIGSVLESYGKTLQEVDRERHVTLGPIYGHFEGNRPHLSVADPKLLRDIFVRDFPVFTNRRIFETGDDISDVMVSNLQDEDWKRVRSILSPVFSTGKLKRIMSVFKDCSRTLGNNFKEMADKKEPINVKKFYETFIMDVIAMSAFSTKINAHKDPQNKFVLAARAVFGTGLTWRFLFLALAPRLMKLLNISVSIPYAMEFFTTTTTEIINERKRTNQKRNDFLQLLMDVADEVEVEEKLEDIEKVNDLANSNNKHGQNEVTTPTNKSLSRNELIAQCIIFFVAGFETLALAFSAATYVLATQQDVQEKVRKEIEDCLKETNGTLTYEVFQNMKYLDCFLSETLRMYPPLIKTERKAASTYELGDTGILLEKDMLVSIPIYALHHDPKYFPDPEKFNPNRFIPEEKGKRDPYVYLPFGSGPRNCLGMRFALLQMKVCLVHIISHFNINPCSKTQIPMQFHRGFGILKPKDILLDIEPREDCLQVS
ncbi:cytochrome P450 3A8 [Parasteatoda tepidariorum]|uniref:cytochrome P450 3A8 n=1 Tax=Parasteatoda tepidariorum TaxID=114398 RepID=UPI0039BD727B